MNKVLNLLSECPNLPPGVDINVIAPYLLHCPSVIPGSSETQNQRLIHYKKAAETIPEKISEASVFVGELQAQIEEREKAEIIENFDEPLTLYEKNIHRFLFQCAKKYGVRAATNNFEAAKQQLAALEQLAIFADWLTTNPLPLIINLEKASPRSASKSFVANQSTFKRYRAIKIAAREKTSFFKHRPILYRNVNSDRALIRAFVDTAMSARKANTSYFESPTTEEEIFRFFDSTKSPIGIAGLLPITVGDDPSEAISWINQAAASIASLDAIPIEERRDVIDILVTRYFFERTYPKFQPVNKPDSRFLKVREKIRHMKPDEAHIPKKYIPPACVDLPISAIFESSSIAKAPVMWMNMIQFKVCPLDVAYCIFKVHESLSIMATLQATENSQGKTSEDFYKKMPGFDDIFDLWLCLLCYSDLADPAAMNEFVGNWTRLPGFSQRFLACCAYLEAAVAQINSLGEEEEEKAE